MTTQVREQLHALSVAVFAVVSTLIIARGVLVIAAVTPVSDNVTLTLCFFVFWATVGGCIVAWLVSLWSVIRLATLYDSEQEYRRVAGLTPQSAIV